MSGTGSKEGYWISLKGESIEIVDPPDAVRAEPEKFGFTREEAGRWRRKDRIPVLRRAVRRGWIRVRGHGQYTTFDVYELTPAAKARIRGHMRRVGAWKGEILKVHEVRRGTVRLERAGHILSGGKHGRHA